VLGGENGRIDEVGVDAAEVGALTNEILLGRSVNAAEAVDEKLRKETT
jgi:hypothetical protein